VPELLRVHEGAALRALSLVAHCSNHPFVFESSCTVFWHPLFGCRGR
jgi:hypothetical protein